MAKQSGLGSEFWVGSVDLSGDTGAINTIETMRAVLDAAAISQGAMDRMLARRDGSLSFAAYWDPAVGASHPTLSALPRTDVQVTVAAGTPAVGSAAASLIAKQVGYAPAFGADGSLVATVAASANGVPLEWGELLTTGRQTFASGTVNGASIDLQSVYPLLTDTAFGAAAYLHVFALGSGTPAVTVADSANNTDFATLAPSPLAFAPVAAGVERQVTGLAATVRRYVRVQVTGTYTALVCALNFVRYTESMAV